MCSDLIPVYGIPGYVACPHGTVIGPRGIPLRIRTNDKGYFYVRMRRDNKTFDKKLRVLLLETFKEPRPAGLVGRHLNDIKSDCSLDNLEWGTHAQNYADFDRNHPDGRRKPSARPEIVVIHGPRPGTKSLSWMTLDPG